MIVAMPLGKEVVLIRLEGCDTLDTLNAEAVKLAALRNIDGSADVVVDLSSIEFIDSTGVGVLVSILKAARRNGRDAHFAGVTPGVRSILAVVKLDRIFNLHEDAASAARALATSRMKAAAARP